KLYHIARNVDPQQFIAGPIEHPQERPVPTANVDDPPLRNPMLPKEFDNLGSGIPDPVCIACVVYICKIGRVHRVSVGLKWMVLLPMKCAPAHSPPIFL